VRVRPRRERVQQPEYCAQDDEFRVCQFLQPELFPGPGYPGHDAAVVDPARSTTAASKSSMPSGVSCSTAPGPARFPPGTSTRVASIEPDPAQHACRNSIQGTFIAPEAIVSCAMIAIALAAASPHADLAGRRQRTQHEQQRLPLDGEKVIGQGSAMVRGTHGNRRSRQLRDALFGVSARDLDARVNSMRTSSHRSSGR